MLPRPADIGARLAAVLPTCIAAIEKYRSGSIDRSLAAMPFLRDSSPEQITKLAQTIPPARSVLVVVVDGLGFENLAARKGHARALSALHSRRIETVIPTTTGAALPTLTTGRLPGAHGLLGYKIRHDEAGLVNTLNEWHLVPDHSQWLLAESLFTAAQNIGIHCTAIGRPAHEHTPFTRSVLQGAEYFAAQTIQQRFDAATAIFNNESAQLVYLYIDELDKAGHSRGWQSDAWLQRLEQLDHALQHFLKNVSKEIGIVVTSDHGMIDVADDDLIVIDQGDLGEILEVVSHIGGEPRMRSLYFNDQSHVPSILERLHSQLHNIAFVGTRDEAVSLNWFGPVEPEIARRFGDIVITPKRTHAFVTRSEREQPHFMIGQHGGLTEIERGVMLSLGSAFNESSFHLANKLLSQLIDHT